MGSQVWGQPFIPAASPLLPYPTLTADSDQRLSSALHTNTKRVSRGSLLQPATQAESKPKCPTGLVAGRRDALVKLRIAQPAKYPYCEPLLASRTCTYSIQVRVWLNYPV